MLGAGAAVASSLAVAYGFYPRTDQSQNKTRKLSLSATLHTKAEPPQELQNLKV